MIWRGEKMKIRRLATTALVAAQVAMAAPPAGAAELIGDGSHAAQQRGAFAGARFHLPLGSGQAAKPRLGLALAPLQQSRQLEGGTLTRFGEGVELGFRGDDKLRLSFGGRPVSQLVAGGGAPGGRKLGVSTTGWVAIGVGTVLVAGTILVAWGLHEARTCPGGGSSHGGC
jgi:hypothetical protein